MADWPNITDSQCDPDAPVTSELIYGLRDGPIAIAEGADGAPRIVPEARSATNAVVTAGDTNPVQFLNLGGLGAVPFWITTTAAASTSNVQVSYTSNGGTSWSGWFDISGSTDTAQNQIVIYNRVAGILVNLGTNLNPVSMSTTVNGIRFRCNNSGKSIRAGILDLCGVTS